MLKVNFSNQAEKKLEFYEKRLVQIAKRISSKISQISKMMELVIKGKK